MSNLMSIKLDSVNYIVWKLQLTTILDAYFMIDRIDGSVQRPSQYLVDVDGNFTTRANPSFLSWKKRDKTLLTLIYSTLSPPVLAMVVGLNSAQEVWNNWNKGSQPTFNGQNPNSFNKPEHNRPTYQICGKIGHYAIDCYHRMDFAHQGKNPPTKLAAMANASNLNITQGNSDTWLTNFGASDHITANLNNLNQPIPFKGLEQVSVGNSQNLPIQNIEPPTFKIATQISQWCQTMRDEYDTLIRQGTWSLVPPPENHNIVGCKWVYKLKTHIDGSIARYKARLVEKGFHQQQGIDFDETLSPVIKPLTVRMILSLAVSLNWPLRQLDQIPPYSSTDQKTTIAYLLLYVDDIVLTSNTLIFLDTLIYHLSSIFELKDLRPLHYFLGIQVTRDSKGLHLSQAKYATALFQKHNMSITKPISTPCTPNTRLSLHDGEKLHDLHAYRILVGALHYLTFTRPDISFAVHQVCQYMASPTSVHLTAAKRILRYLKGTLHLGLSFRPGPLTLSTFTDADWDDDPDDRRSTSSLLVYLEAPILWCENISTFAIASNPVFHARTKHIEVDFNFVRERVLRKDLAVKFVSTLDQLVDIFTKSLPAHRFLDLRSCLMATIRPAELEEGC
uniref:Reverse transcriptase Ty1/copia-type domain-containing protein n=1 Tax=Fagus sylvatica TaxID=28930 RepID=A0A2N9IKE8_FAGSY